MAALPEQFPIFPLTGALLLPEARLPLNIFEPRYLAMTEDALAAGRHIGMIQPNPSLPAGPTGPGLHRVGCVGRLVSFAETDDGRYLITLLGLSRFRIADELPMQRGYRRVRADFSPFAADIEPPSPAALDREPLFDALRRYFAQAQIDANWAALESMPDAPLVATLAMACPFAPLEKQALLEAPDFTSRVETLLALLHMASHEGSDDTPARPS